MHDCMSFWKFWTFLPIHQIRERWSLARNMNGLKRWRYKSWQGICKNVEIRVQTLGFPGGKSLNSCTLPLQWPLPQQSSYFQNDLTLVVWSPSVEPKWENKMALDLLTHLLKWNREMRSQGLVMFCAEQMQQALLGPWGLGSAWLGTVKTLLSLFLCTAANTDHFVASTGYDKTNYLQCAPPVQVVNTHFITEPGSSISKVKTWYLINSLSFMFFPAVLFSIFSQIFSQRNLFADFMERWLARDSWSKCTVC